MKIRWEKVHNRCWQGFYYGEFAFTVYKYSCNHQRPIFVLRNLRNDTVRAFTNLDAAKDQADMMVKSFKLKNFWEIFKDIFSILVRGLGIIALVAFIVWLLIHLLSTTILHNLA